MSDILALKVSDLDNVATIFANDVKAGMIVTIRDKKGNSVEETLLADIPYGHKVAVKPIKKEEPKEAKNDKFNQLKFGDNYDVE